MADAWSAFPDAEPPAGGLVIDMTPAPRPGQGDAWAAFPDAPQEGSAVRTGARMVGQAAQGTLDALTNTVAAPFDLSAAITNKLGLTSGPSRVRQAIEGQTDYTATLPGRLKDAIAQRSLDPLTESRTARFEPETRGEKIASGVGHGLGSVLGTMLPAGVIANAARPGTMTQGLAQTMASQPALQTASGVASGAVTGATDNPWLGLTAGVGVPLGVSAARGVISPVANRLSPHEAATARFAKTEGVPLTPAQSTGSPVLRGLEETMAKLPFGSGPMQKAYEGQRAAFNQSTLKRAGVDAADASPDTLNTAFRQAGNTFDDLAARTTLKPSQEFADDVLKVATDYGRRLSTDVAPVFKSYMDDLQPVIDLIAKGDKPEIAGDVYKTIRSDMGKRIRNTSNTDLKDALKGLQKALDKVVDSSASPALMTEWKEARRQYQALKTVDEAMQGGTQADRSAGNIPYSSLKSVVARGDRDGFSRGRGQMNESARLADFLSSRVPDSGTPGRVMWANLLTGGALMGGGGVATAGGFTPSALAAAAATAAGPAIASRLYNSGAAQKYLTNQVAGSTDLKAILAAQGAQQALQNTGEPRQLARAMMQANERRQRAAR